MSLDIPLTTLGEFLRVRRRQATPVPATAGTGVPASRRRTPGLRREEVATESAVSANYYIRLEQGRERHPSDSVLAALADTMDLDLPARDHLWDLAAAERAPVRTGPPDNELEDDPAFLSALVDGFAPPALVVTPWMDVLAANAAGRRLYGADVPGGNLLLETFLQRSAQERYPAWEAAAECSAGTLRAAAGRFPHHPRIHQLHRELTRSSSEFAHLWDRAVVTAKQRGTKVVRDQDGGCRRWEYQLLALPQSRTRQILVYRAVDDTAAGREPVADCASLGAVGQLSASVAVLA